MSRAIRVDFHRCLSPDVPRGPGNGPWTRYLDTEAARRLLADALDDAGPTPAPMHVEVPARVPPHATVCWDLVEHLTRLGWLDAYRDPRYFRVFCPHARTAEAWDHAIRTEIALRAEAARGVTP